MSTIELLNAHGFRSRLVGLLGRSAIAPGVGLWLRPCRAVHTFGMRFSIDVVFVDADGRVIRVDSPVEPWRVRACLRASGVVELANGEARRLGVEPGALLVPRASSTAGEKGTGAVIPAALTAFVAIAGSAVVERAFADPAATGTFSTRPATAAADVVVVPDAEPDPIAPAPPALAPGPSPTPETVARQFDEAERAYRAQQWSRAMDAFKAIVARVPNHRQAWLRIGNLHHLRRQFTSAAGAYRRAAARADTDPAGSDAQVSADMETRNKALVNLALVNLDLARLALDEVHAPSTAIAAARVDAARQFDALESQIRSRDRPGDAAGRQANAALAPVPAQAASASAQSASAPTAPASAQAAPAPTAPSPAQAAPAPAAPAPASSVTGPGVPSSTTRRGATAAGMRPSVEYLSGAPSR